MNRMSDLPRNENLLVNARNLRRNMTKEDAEAAIYRHDKKRKSYHNYYCTSKWGDSRAYDLCLNSSKMGTDKTVDMLEDYIRFRMEK